MTDESVDNPIEEPAPEAPQSPEGGSLEKPSEIKKQHHRDKIKASVLMDRLQKNAMGELAPPMTRDQIRSTEILLKKIVPDLASITISGDDDKPPVRTVTEIVLVGPKVNVPA